MSKPDITGGVAVPFEPRKLDGTATHDEFKVPFDAHDKVLRAATNYEHQEYPKAIGYDVNGDPVLAMNETHEAELSQGKE